MRRGQAGAVFDEGSALVEYTFATVILLLPLVYLALTLAEIQAASMAAVNTATVIAKDAARNPGLTPREVGAVADLTMADFGISGERTVQVHCERACDEAGALVTAEVSITVDLPGMPEFLRTGFVDGVPVRARHAEVIAEQ